MKILAAQVALCLLAASPLALAGAPRVDDAPAADETARPEPTCENGLALPLSGLTEENAKDVERALRKMTRPRYRCPACKMKADWQATCEGCGELFEPMPTGVGIFSDVRLDVAGQEVCLELDRSSVLSMMDLGKALQPTGVDLRRGDIPVVAWTRVTVRMDPRDVAGATRALQRPGLFASVGVRRSDDSPSTSFVIQHPPRKPVTLARMAEALGEATPGGLVFEDLSWTAPCLTCEEKGLRRGACRACWQAEIRRERNRERLR